MVRLSPRRKRSRREIHKSRLFSSILVRLSRISIHVLSVTAFQGDSEGKGGTSHSPDLSAVIFSQQQSGIIPRNPRDSNKAAENFLVKFPRLSSTGVKV